MRQKGWGMLQPSGEHAEKDGHAHVMSESATRRLDLLQPFGMRWTHHSATSNGSWPTNSNDMFQMPSQHSQKCRQRDWMEALAATDVTACTNLVFSSSQFSFVSIV